MGGFCVGGVNMLTKVGIALVDCWRRKVLPIYHNSAA